MNRRRLLTAASGAAVPALLLAMRQTVLAQGPTASSDEILSITEHASRTLQLGSLSLQASDLALQRAQNPRVREFAGFERNEQITIAQVLTDTQAPEPVKLDQANAAILQALSAATGPQFDVTYVADQIQLHTQLMQAQQAFIQGQPRMETDDVHVAMLTRMVIQMHQTMLIDLQNALRG